MNLSPSFLLEEMVRSQVALRLGIDNTPNSAQIEHLKNLCMLLLEPARTILGVPLHVDSGYRSPELNSAVGGSHDSAHMDGRAADLIPIGMSLQDAFDTLRLNTALPIDQIIIECNAWIHLGAAESGVLPRREALLASGSPGNWEYWPVLTLPSPQRNA